MDEETIFLGALEKAATERDGYLTRACGGDADLRSRVERRLHRHGDVHAGVWREAGKGNFSCDGGRDGIQLL